MSLLERFVERVDFDSYEDFVQNFKIKVPENFNFGFDVVDVYADTEPEREALIWCDDEGNEKIKTIGKLLDEKICLEGMSTIVLKTNVTDGVYTFLTQNNGKDTVKSPAGMFPSYAIDNDLHYVDQKIRSYYELGEFLTDEDMKEIDEAVKKEDIPIADEKKSRRGQAVTEAPAEEKPLPRRKRRTEAPAPEEQPAEESQPKKRRRRREKPDILDAIEEEENKWRDKQ